MVQTRLERPDRNLAADIEMTDLAQRMDTTVSPPTALDIDLLPQHRQQRLLDPLLHAHPVFLALPAMITRSVIADSHTDAAKAFAKGG